MRVKATQLGYYNHRRQREGVIFDLLKESDFSEIWMERLEAKPEKVKAKVKSKKKEAEVELPSDEDVI